MAERIPTTALNRRAGEVIQRAAEGAVIELTRHGKTVAIVTPSFEGAAAQFEAAVQIAKTGTATGGTAFVHTIQTQADPHTATSPELRPAKAADPVQASREQTLTAQQRRDQLLRGSRR